MRDKWDRRLEIAQVAVMVVMAVTVLLLAISLLVESSRGPCTYEVDMTEDGSTAVCR